MTSRPITFVGTEAAQTRIARLRSRRGAAERVNSIRAEMAEADRACAETSRQSPPSRGATSEGIAPH
ncbi:hypothetical protein [Actinoplanes sp. GCM10030250]|uniref:hypothetical protein n=1 Tax=Actinoplanes sp. GCM10030250 TaxID=3273376 RepID=UPI0036167D10